ncbi:MAG: hypothetical protein V3S09_05530 [Candidatus Bathyarchaeia archaeon]
METILLIRVKADEGYSPDIGRREISALIFIPNFGTDAIDDYEVERLLGIKI